MRTADKIANLRNFDAFEDSAGTEASSAATCTDRLPKFGCTIATLQQVTLLYSRRPRHRARRLREASGLQDAWLRTDGRTCPKPSITDGTNFLNSSLLKQTCKLAVNQFVSLSKQQCRVC